MLHLVVIANVFLKERKILTKMKKFDLKSILIGALIGIIGTTSVFFLIGDIDIETEIQLGKKETKKTENIDICRCLIEPGNSQWSKHNKSKCDEVINDYLGFNWETTNFSLKSNKSKNDKWNELKSNCGY